MLFFKSTNTFCQTLFFAWLILLFPCALHAQEKTLRVGVAIGDPFVIVTNGQYSGIAIDIWNLIAAEQNIKFSYVNEGEHIDDAIRELAAGKIDILVGPVIPTIDRMRSADFMQPYYLNQVGLVVSIAHVGFFDAFSSVFSDTFGFMFAIYLIIFIFYLHIYWYFELRKNHRFTYWPGIAEAFWLHSLDIDIGKIPSHVITRYFRFIWLVLLALFFSSITASITSALTIALTEKYHDYTNIADIKNKKVTAVIHTAPYDIGKQLGFDILPVLNRNQAINLLLQHKVSAYIDYYPIADYYLMQHDLTKRLVLSNLIIERNTFSFALPFHSPLRPSLNARLREQQDSGMIKLICQKYFKNNEKAVLNCEI